ncbi:hypothetical protein B0H17DRAFT_980386 [Mycena rosella]|uniref:Uncharacterized protein n=1 Tax=Mycena rosella TaxID=1033263 RepID=A0AAD7DPK0_MYCRO|nr:hypothetical protein B0H17DRAFT_980386 [Mycena rosella]
MASETSPLLSREPTPSFPTISAALARLGDRVNRVNIEDICPRDVEDVCKDTAFCLIVLLELRTRKLRQKPSSDIWNHWTQMAVNANDANRLNDQIIDTWDLFLDEYRTSAEIEQVLWTSFPSTADSVHRFRVVDLLNADCPSQLICHDVVILSLASLWKHGPSREASAQPNSTGIGSRYDAVCTPRVLHAIDLTTHLTYFGLLVSFVLHPPYEPVISHTRLEYIGPREILLMLFSASILVRPWTLFNIPFAITLLIFLFNLPAVPFAGSASFTILLLSFAFHAFQFHFPRPPSPLFILKLHRSLPFAGFLAHGFYDLVFPITLFFLPIIILSTYWLSMALSDTFFAPSGLIGLSTLPTPMETRTTVLFMFFAVIAIISCSLFIFVVQGRDLEANASGWDAYSPTIGRAARASFAGAIVSYSSPYTFPAPFSLLQAVLIRGPSAILVDRLGFQLPFAQAEKILWRICVGPVGLVFGLVMLPLP